MSGRRQRVDVALVQRGFFESRAKAQEAIATGLVTADGVIVRKTSELIAPRSRLRAEAPYPYVSRGGVKLAKALAEFGFDPRGKVCLDIGASTGGFTDVFLRCGAALVYAVDVGHGQLHPGIAARDEVVSMERTDARRLVSSMFRARPEIVACDVSFISLKLILPHVLELAAPRAALIALIKPQFELQSRQLKKGIVRDAALHASVCGEISETVGKLGWTVRRVTDSPIAGGDGNREFLLGAIRA